MANDLLRVKAIEVNGLFGLYNHRIDLNLHERITIIHGPNGVGKTVLLKLVAALFSGRLIEITRAHFDTFSVTLSDGTEIGFSRRTEFSDGDRFFKDDVSVEQLRRFRQQAIREVIQRRREKVVVKFFLTENGRREEFDLGALPDDVSASKLAGYIDSETPWLFRSAADQWTDRQSNEYLSAYQVIEKYSDRLPLRYRSRLFKEPEPLGRIRSKVNIHFIETQRLLKFALAAPEWRRSTEESIVSMVKTYAKDLHSKISSVLTAYAKNSQLLDQSFPQRLLAGQHPQNPPLSSSELKDRMIKLEKRRSRLKQIGLLADDNSYPFDTNALDSLDATRLAVLNLYVSDTQSKLRVLDDSLRRITLFLKIVNKKFRNKTIYMDKQDGLKAVSSSGIPLDLDALSSGEQHELVLIYDLLFRVNPDTLVLIDEPELSLHLTWQKQFLPDLLKIVDASRFDVVIATHSPFVVGDRHDLMVALASEEDQEEQYGEEEEEEEE